MLFKKANKGQLVKGIIYDEPKRMETDIVNTVERLSDMVDNFDADTEDFLAITPCPSYQELFTTSVLDNILYSADGERQNMIIPTDMIDEKLYNELIKIDIGKEIIDAFVQHRCDIFVEELDSRIDISDDKISISFKELPTEEKITAIKEAVKDRDDDVIDNDQLKHIIRQIIAA